MKKVARLSDDGKSLYLLKIESLEDYNLVNVPNYISKAYGLRDYDRKTIRMFNMVCINHDLLGITTRNINVPSGRAEKLFLQLAKQFTTLPSPESKIAFY